MSDSIIFGNEAQAYWDAGYSPVPITSGTKKPSVPKWPSYQSNLPNLQRRESWITQFGDHGIGVLTGTEIQPSLQLAAIDIDDDNLVGAVEGYYVGCKSGKCGKKGLTIFVAAPKSDGLKSTTFAGREGVGNVDILIGGRQTVIPPTIHPDTGAAYRWVGKPLLDAPIDRLPQHDNRKHKGLKKLVESQHCAAIISGKNTHEPVMRLVAELVSAGCTDEEINGAITGLLPPGYQGNSLTELPGMITSARQKNFDLSSRVRTYQPGEVGPIPLGYTKEGPFVLRDQIRDIILALSPQQLLSKQVLIGLAPSEFWEKQYPSSKGGFSPMVAGEALITASRMGGPFDTSKVRGVGVWREGDQIIRNFGGELPGRLTHQYISFTPTKIPNNDTFDVGQFRDLLGSFPFTDPGNADLLLGWFVLAPICGALDWRPHVFLFGPPNSGKTTLHNIASKILHPLVIAADGQSTEAGIRQSLGPDALPTIFDEFETDSSQSRLQGIMRLARSASSAESPLLRGTPEGKAVQFNIRSMFLLSAVNVLGLTPADQSRITIMELKAHKSDPEVAANIELEVAHFAKLGPRWCGYIIGLAPVILETIPIIRTGMSAFNTQQRQSYGSILAGLFVALNKRVPTRQEALDLVEEYRPTIQAHRVDQERNNAQECLDHLLAQPFRGQEGAEHPLGHWLSLEVSRIQNRPTADHAPDAQRIVEGLQIRVVLSESMTGVLVRNGAPPIDKLSKDTRWANGSWQRALGQHNGSFKPTYPQRFPGIAGKHRCVGLPLDIVPNDITDPANESEF